jgi:hypothetical protein
LAAIIASRKLQLEVQALSSATSTDFVTVNVAARAVEKNPKVIKTKDSKNNLNNILEKLLFNFQANQNKQSAALEAIKPQPKGKDATRLGSAGKAIWTYYRYASFFDIMRKKV